MILVTGADGSLGRAICEVFPQTLQMPKKVWIQERIDDFLASHGSSVRALTGAVLNDGTNHLSWIGTTPRHDEEIILRNVMAPYWTLDKLVEMRGRNSPMKVVFVTSQTYRVPQRTTALYCASKAAAHMLMRVAARELAPYGWQINAVAPGKIVDTKMSELTDQQVKELRGWSEEQMDRYAIDLIPMKRFTSTHEVAAIIAQTMELQSYVNGTVIEAFGGV